MKVKSWIFPVVLLFVAALWVRFGNLLQRNSQFSVEQQKVIYQSRAMAIRFSRDGKRLISAGGVREKGDVDKRLRVWNVKSGRGVWRLPAQPISAWEYNPENTLLMPGFDLMLTTWGAWEVKPIHIHSFRFEKSIEVNCGLISSLVLSPDEKILAIGMTRAVEFRDARTFKLLRTCKHGGQGTIVRFGPDSNTVICTWGGSKPQAIEVATAKQIHYPRWFYCVRGTNIYAFSPDGKRLARANGQTIEIWTTPTSSDAGRQLGTLKTSLPTILTLQFSPDGKTLAVGGLSKSLSPVEFLAVSK